MSSTNTAIEILDSSDEETQLVPTSSPAVKRAKEATKVKHSPQSHHAFATVNSPIAGLDSRLKSKAVSTPQKKETTPKRRRVRQFADESKTNNDSPVARKRRSPRNHRDKTPNRTLDIFLKIEQPRSSGSNRKRQRSRTPEKKPSPLKPQRDFLDSDSDEPKQSALRKQPSLPKRRRPKLSINVDQAGNNSVIALLSTPDKGRNSFSAQKARSRNTPPATLPTDSDVILHCNQSPRTKQCLRKKPPVPDISGVCWSCSVPLKLPEPQVCWYQPHAHIHLGVPSCCVCNEAIIDMETEAAADEDIAYCAGCGDQEDGTTFLLCDVCPLAFCIDCVTKAHDDCPEQVQAIINSDEEWKCLECAPTKRIIDLQNITPVSRSKDDLLDELFTAEEEKERCQSLPVDESNEAQRLKERRLDDFIACCLDELEQLHDMTPAMVYNLYQDKETTQNCLDRQQHDSDNEDDTNTPSYVKAANKAIRNREKQEKADEKYSGADQREDWYKENFVDVEDLGSDGEAVPVSKCWRAMSSNTLQKSDILEAEKNERCKRINVTVVKDADDKAAEKSATKSKRDFSSMRHGKASSAKKASSSDSKLPTAKKTLSGLSVRGVSNRGSKQAAISTPSRSTTSSPTASSVASPFIMSGSIRELTPRKKPCLNLTDRLADEWHSAADGLADSLVLCSRTDGHSRTVSVEPSICEKLKQHQREGIQFMWNNSFIDCAKGDDSPGGCILAHAMGLGKSLSAIALIHTAMTHPEMYCGENDRFLVHRVVLLCPVNTIANWENEFHKWQKNLKQSVTVTNLSGMENSYRPTCVKNWYIKGGVLLVSDKLLLQVCKDSSAESRLLKADLVLIDEAHTMLSNPRTITYKTLQNFATPRRIGLTGSPFQNNLLEYFHLIKFVRPDAFDFSDEKTFKSTYELPINKGMASDANYKDALLSLTKSKELNEKLSRFLHRVDASVLQRDLGPLHHHVLHVRQTSVQQRILYNFKQKQKSIEKLKNFFVQAKKLQPVLNHPGALLTATNEPSDEEWWQGIVSQIGQEKVKHVVSGNKIVILLHILAKSEQLGDKVLIFCNCLSSLNYIEQVLAMDDWASQVPSLTEYGQIGGWTKDIDFLRIDGSDSASDRGNRVKQFEEKESSAKAFLLSKAGGIGINLVSANRVVLFDCHFNPTVASQAVCRSYRIGQTKEVFVYRLLTKGTMEERVYGRCVNKTGVAFRVIDQMSIERSFTASELENLSRTFIWCQCEDCEKWRVLPGATDEENLPERWTCSMNADTDNNSCDHPERTQLWYERKWGTCNDGDDSLLELETETDEAKTDPDEFNEVLKHLIELKSKNSTLIDKHYSHQDLLKTTDCPSEMAKLERGLEKLKKQHQQQAEMLAKLQAGSGQASSGKHSCTIETRSCIATLVAKDVAAPALVSSTTPHRTAATKGQSSFAKATPTTTVKAQASARRITTEDPGPCSDGHFPEVTEGSEREDDANSTDDRQSGSANDPTETSEQEGEGLSYPLGGPESGSSDEATEVIHGKAENTGKQRSVPNDNKVIDLCSSDDES